MSKRIQKIAHLARGNSAIDVGADHGYLLIELYQMDFKNLLAIEKNKGPLLNCINNVKSQNLQNNIKILLSDGLKELSIAETQNYENIVIAGMGGDLINNIIQNDIQKFKNSFLILQPNNNEYKLREFLNNNKFEIIEETIIQEGKKNYEIIVAKYSANNKQTLNEEQLMFGLKHDFSSIEFQTKWSQEEEYLKSLISDLKQKDIQITSNIVSKLEMIIKRRSQK